MGEGRDPEDEHEDRCHTRTHGACLAWIVPEGDAFTIPEFHKRGYRDPDDPRNLFAAMYGGVYKRGGPADEMMRDLPPMEGYYNLKGGNFKRGLRDPDDPRNLFHSVYGGVWK